MVPKTLDVALTCHIDWVGRVVAAVTTGRCPPELVNETEHVSCAFAQWLDGNGHAGDPDLAEVRRLHETMHASATQVLRLVTAGYECFEAFERLSAEILAFNRAATQLRDPVAGDA